MEMNKNLCRRLGNLSLPVLLSVVLLASCRDEIETGAYTGPYIRFSVSEGSEWHSTRAAGGPAEKAVPRDSVQPLHGGDGNTPLYLHTLYTDSIASPSSDGRPYPCHARKNGDSLRIVRHIGIGLYGFLE